MPTCDTARFKYFTLLNQYSVNFTKYIIIIVSSLHARPTNV